MVFGICKHLIDDFNRLETLYKILIAVTLISVIPIILLALIPVSQHEESLILKLMAYKSGQKVGGLPDIGLTHTYGHTHASKCSATLNLIVDFAHNFMDGMAIASTFMMSPMSGMTTTVSVFFHEIPHEISDYAILLNAGFSPFKAMVVTAGGAFSGAIFTYYLGRVLEHAHSHIIPSLTAGGFIYISCVNIVPCILSSQGSAAHFVAESASILVGTLVLTLLD
ncbi:LOW QUALITY PROTEIN: hypothetical protein MXB_4723 [Myxobolus squamalis]|nr:LOW QUALITY PROTEIN: hypothetical protein MXB_4723 [Myxobolus squamalis]